MNTQLSYVLIIILAILLVVILFGFNKSNKNTQNAQNMENMTNMTNNIRVNTYSDSAISQQNRNMHEPNLHPNSKCISYRPHYDSSYSGHSNCSNHHLDNSFQLYDHLDKQNQAMGLDHSNSIHGKNMGSMTEQHVDKDRNIMLPFAYFDKGKGSHKIQPNMSNTDIISDNTCINNDRILESNNIDGVCNDSEIPDLKNIAYSNEIHENLDMDNDRSTTFDNMKPHICTFNKIDTNTSVLPLAYDSSYKNISTVDGLDNIGNYVDITNQDRLDDIHKSNTKNLVFVNNSNMYNKLV
jgi:hypothetical protein